MRAFLWVIGGMAALVIALFLMAGGAAPLPPFEPRLAAGETLESDDARRAFAAWIGELPTGVAAPLRVHYACEFRGAEPAVAPTTGTLELAFVDARRGSGTLRLAGADGRLMLGVGWIADGARIVTWLQTVDESGAPLPLQAASIEQRLAEEIWALLRANAAPFLQLAQIAEVEIDASVLPEHLLEFVHPGAWTRRGLANWRCERLTLEGESLRAELRPAADESSSFSLLGAGFAQALQVEGAVEGFANLLQGVGLTAEFDARTGAWLAVEAADGGPDASAVSLSLHATDFARRATQDDLRLPEGLQPEDWSARARAMLPLLQAAAGAGAGGSSATREF